MEGPIRQTEVRKNRVRKRRVVRRIYECNTVERAIKTEIDTRIE